MWSSISVFTVLALTPSVLCHMQLSNPYPINSPLNPDISYAVKDYSYTNPLSADGSNFPCKGYHTQTPILFTATYVSGQSYSITIAGSATHGGGSCQISLSYDSGATFKVIKSMMGGCPLIPTYDFTVPAFAPSGNALLAWTWFNKIGNREIYMNCAWVTVAGTSSRIRRDTSSFNALPNIFLANIPQASGVITLSNEVVTFPNPGSVIVYGDGISASTPLGQGYSGVSQANNGVSVSNPSVVQEVPSSSSPNPAATSAVDGVKTSSSLPTISVVPLSTNTLVYTSSTKSKCTEKTTTEVVTATRSNSVSSSPTTISIPSSSSTVSVPIAVGCSPGTLVCPSLNTYALCNADGTSTSPQAVAPGTQCSNGGIVAASVAGSCTSAPGVWLCTSQGQSFSSCSNGMWVNMGSVAPGTICSNGQIVLA